MPAAPWQDVLDAWFLPATDPQHLRPQARWFARDDTFDAMLRARFADTVRAALAGRLDDWADAPWGALARILLLDQSTRNIWRGTPAAFSGDPLARAGADAALAAGHDQQVPPVARAFFYLPFEHGEDLASQDRSVALFDALAAVDPQADTQLDYAHRHRDVILRFGRFPHRNRILGRVDTPSEAEYLAQPGAGF